MEDRERSDAPTAVERPRGSAPSDPDVPLTSTDDGPGETPSPIAPGSAFDPPSDRFEARSELGRGGMGRVDEAYDRALGRAVAIKHMLRPGAMELARFEREARITARLEHPGIVPIHDAGRTADGTPYYVMRRVDGRPLSEVSDRKTLDERLALVPNLLAACDAAAYAHARGIVHRDIKPTNILIGPFGETLLIDWGLAREIADASAPDPGVLPSEPDLTRAGTVAGTPGFMSPEQARGEAVDARADVFALGVTLFFVLSGKLPWVSSSATEMVNHVGANRAPSWHLLPKEVPVDLRAVLEKAMAADPRERYSDAGALATDLRRFITGNLVGAYDYGVVARFVRYVKRHRAAAAVALVSLVVVAVIATISVRRVVAERDDANAARALAEQRHRESNDLADSLLVDSAAQLAETNPVAAIAKLRRLSPTSKRWREAWAAATTAWFHGIPFGFVNEPGHALVQISADNHTALLANLRTGKLAVLDLIARTHRAIATLPRTFNCSWLEAAKSIACVHEGALSVIEVATSAVRSFPLDIETIFTNRRDRVLIHAHDKRVLELRPDAREPIEIMTGVDDLTPSSDLEWLVITRGSQMELRHGDRSWPIRTNPDDRNPPVVNVNDGTVTLVEWGHVRVLQVERDELVQRARVERTVSILGVATAAGRVFLITPTGIELLDFESGRLTMRRIEVRGIFHTQGGFIVGGANGEMLVSDREGLFNLGQRPVNYGAVDQSADLRFVLAVTDAGDCLAWDLTGPRGQSFNMPSSEMAGHIDTSNLWAYEEGGGLYRHTLPSGTGELMLPIDWMMARWTFDYLGRWVSIQRHDAPQLFVYDQLANKTWASPETATSSLTADDHGMAFAIDRTVFRWRPGTGEDPREMTQLPFKPKFIATAPSFVLGLAADGRELVRAHLATGQLDRAVAERTLDRIVLESNGRAWLVSEGEVSRWELGATPVLVPTPEPVLDIIGLETGVLLRSSKALAIHDGDQQRMISAESAHFRVMGRDLIAIQAQTNVLHVVDLVTARTIKVPQRSARAFSLVASGTRLGAIMALLPDRQWRFTYWDLLVPREPAALQQWLATITNATPVPGSDAVAWPTR